MVEESSILEGNPRFAFGPLSTPIGSCRLKNRRSDKWLSRPDQKGADAKQVLETSIFA